MNKKEAAALEAALTQASMYCTQPVPCDLPQPGLTHGSSGHAYTQGWTFRVHLGPWVAPYSVCEAWSEYSVHGNGQYQRAGTNRGGTQGGRALYSTRLLALRAARYEAEQQVKRALREIDREIEAELRAAHRAATKPDDESSMSKEQSK